MEHGESDAGQIISASGSVPLTKDAEGEVTEILGWFYGDLVGLDGDLVVILWYFTGDFIVFIVIYWDFMMIYWDLMVIDWWFMYSWLDLMWFLWGKYNITGQLGVILGFVWKLRILPQLVAHF